MGVALESPVPTHIAEPWARGAWADRPGPRPAHSRPSETSVRGMLNGFGCKHVCVVDENWINDVQSLRRVLDPTARK